MGVNVFRYLLVLVVVPALLAGCQSAPSQLVDPFAYTSTKQRFIDQHRQQARRLEDKGALREAQREWQLVHALSPSGGVANDQIRRLAGEIEQRFVRHLAAAEKAFAKRQAQRARTHLLKALALKPDSTAAIGLMRRNEARLAYARLDANPAVARGEISEADAYLAAQAPSRRTTPW